VKVPTLRKYNDCSELPLSLICSAGTRPAMSVARVAPARPSACGEITSMASAARCTSSLRRCAVTMISCRASGLPAGVSVVAAAPD